MFGHFFEISICSLMFFGSILILSSVTVQAAKPTIQIHYLGHASFIMQFDNGISVLTDYGQSNSYGLPSPIYEFGTFQPEIVTYSHKDADHYRADVSFENAHVFMKSDLSGIESLQLNGLEISSVFTTERTKEDNTSFIFTYKGLTIVHVGDAQGDIVNLEKEEVKARIKTTFPDTIDLLLMPIGWTQNILELAEAFIDLLQPKRVIPMHYWSPESKQDFLTLLETQNGTAGKHYQIQRLDGAKYSLSTTDTSVTPISVISLEPGPFAQK